MAAGIPAFARVVAFSMMVSAPAQTQGNGKALFAKRCGGCHALDRDKEGPRLHGVYGRAAAAVDSFPYSTPLKNSRLIWTGENLDKWLAGPENLVRDNDMAFYVESADERREIIQFLKQNP